MKTDTGRKADHRLHDLLHYAPCPDMTPTAFKEAGVGNINLAATCPEVKNIKGEVISFDRSSGAGSSQGNQQTGGLCTTSTCRRTDDEQTYCIPADTDGYIGITP